MPSNPGNPICPVASWITLPLRSVIDPLALITGLTYFAPNSPLNPEYPPGSSGNKSGRAWLEAAHNAEPCAQCTPMPTKSAKPCGGFAATSAASSELGPNTIGMSIAVFSRIVLAVATAPKSQPARVNGTQGAGAILPFSLIISGVVSVLLPAGSKSGAVQYANETPVRIVPSVL